MGLSFAVASCQYPPGFIDGVPASASYEKLRRHAEQGSLQALLLLGDQVYIDATAGLFDPSTHHDRYVRPYRRLLQMEAMQALINGGLHVRMMLDDHEIEDNWEPVPGDREISKALVEGRRSYLAFCSLPGEDLPAPQGDAPVPLWAEFDLAGIPFFMADTRTERTPRTARTIETARIMSHTQFGRLLWWLEACNRIDRALPKFVASPSILLPRRLRATHRNQPASALRSDAWDGYPWSLHRLLAFIADRQVANLVFLSGDEHLACDAQATITGPHGSATVRSIHSSPLYGPFPFANSQRADLADQESFRFRVGDDEYACAVRTQFAPPGNGFAILNAAQPSGAAWQVDCAFVR